MVQNKHNKQDTHQEENYSVIAGVLAGLIIVLGGGLLRSNQQKIIDILDESHDSIIVEKLQDSDTTKLAIGKDIAVSGFIIRDNEYSYISTSTYGIIGLENINDFTISTDESALIGGTITSFVNNTYFMTINTYSGDKKTPATVETGVVEQAPQDKAFIAQAGLLFSNLITNELTVQANINQQYITIGQNKGNNKVTINYFRCQKGIKNYDCDAELANLNKTKNLEKAYTTSEGDIIYRIKKTNQRYGSIDGRFGYYISSNSQNFMAQVFKTMTFVSNKYIKTNIIPEVKNICSDPSSNVVMSRVSSTNLLFFDDILSIDVSGRDSANKEIQCIVMVDLNAPLGGTAITLDYTNINDRPAQIDDNSEIDLDALAEELKENIPNEDIQVEEISPTVSNITTNTSVKQFPLKPENPLVYTFGAGYTISFPSKNISFGSVNVNTDLGLAGVKCNVQTDVIDYPRKDLLHDDPTLSIYLCSTSLEKGQVGSYGYVASNKPGKAYLIDVKDPSWSDFAKNMIIQD